MTISKDDFLKSLTVKQESITLDTMGGVEVVIKQYTINEYQKVEEARNKVAKNELDYMELIKIGCKYSVVSPFQFTDEILEKLGAEAIPVMIEIFSKVPTIGMTDEQKEAYKKALEENFQKEVKRLSKEENEKKSGKK